MSKEERALAVFTGGVSSRGKISNRWNDEPTLEISGEALDDFATNSWLRPRLKMTWDRKLIYQGYLGTFDGFHLFCQDTADALHDARRADKDSEQYATLQEFREMTHGVRNKPQLPE